MCENKRKLRPTDHPSTFVKLIDSHIAWLDLRWFVFLRPFCKYYYLTVIGNFFFENCQVEGVADEEEVDDQLLWNLQLLSEVNISLSVSNFVFVEG